MSIFKNIIENFQYELKLKKQIKEAEIGVANILVSMRNVLKQGTAMIRGKEESFVVLKESYLQKEDIEVSKSSKETIIEFIEEVDELWEIVSQSALIAKSTLNIKDAESLYSKNCLNDLNKIAQLLKEMEILKNDIIQLNAKMYNLTN